MTEYNKFKQLGVEKLESSGLSLEDAKKSGIEILSGMKTAKLHKTFSNTPSLKINYYDLKGKPLSDWHKRPGFYRIRYLSKPSVEGFDKIADKKVLRYVQEPDTTPVAYYPKGFNDWATIAKDHNHAIIITEGELKALKACKEGFPTIGLGGVYNWRSTSKGKSWIDSLNLIDWRQRNVYIVFDSDYKTNQNVCRALTLLSEELAYQGAFPNLVTLPDVPGLEKLGLDDFLVHGLSANEDFEFALKSSIPLGSAQTITKLNEEYVFVKNPGFIANVEDPSFKLTPGAFQTQESNQFFLEKTLNKDGVVVTKSVPVGAAWLAAPLRNTVSKMTYKPGAEKFFDNVYNNWSGWGATPVKGDVTPFLKLIDHLFTDTEKEAKRWFLQWCAYPLQHPGTKLYSAVLFHGVRQGTGKSLIGYSLGQIYGDNFTEISQNDLESDFNEWSEGKQLVMGDDVTGSNKRRYADRLKKMITQKELRINIKHIKSFTIPDCMNYFFTANHADAMFLEQDDRRTFVHEIVVGPKPAEFYQAYDVWLFKENGANALFDYLLNFDLSDFNPSGSAFKTAAKEQMIDIGRSDIAGWVSMLRERTDDVLKTGNIKSNRDLYTSAELLDMYRINDTNTDQRITSRGMTKALKAEGFRQVYFGKTVNSKNKPGKYFALRNIDKWMQATHKNLVQHIDSQQPDKKKSKNY